MLSYHIVVFSELVLQSSYLAMYGSHNDNHNNNNNNDTDNTDSSSSDSNNNNNSNNSSIDSNNNSPSGERKPCWQKPCSICPISRLTLWISEGLTQA